MQRVSLKFFSLWAILLTLLLTGGAWAGQEKKAIATVQIQADPGLYATEPQPLTVTQCGQCHPGVFQSLKNDGVRHRFACQKCHEKFHAYNPKKTVWEDLMPKCGSCHALVHGPAVKDCSSCHMDPHAPKKMVMNDRLVKACGECHVGPKEQLSKFPSKHSKLQCRTCHTEHGLKPPCLNCHKPHHSGQEASTCATCHSVHKPLQITYEKNVPAVTCGSCHQKVYSKWQATPSRHAKVLCAECHHTRHKNIPQCTECHKALTHAKGIHVRYPNCLTCHLDVHNPPVKQKAATK